MNDIDKLNALLEELPGFVEISDANLKRSATHRAQWQTPERRAVQAAAHEKRTDESRIPGIKAMAEAWKDPEAKAARAAKISAAMQEQKEEHSAKLKAIRSTPEQKEISSAHSFKLWEEKRDEMVEAIRRGAATKAENWCLLHDEEFEAVLQKYKIMSTRANTIGLLNVRGTVAAAGVSHKDFTRWLKYRHPDLLNFRDKRKNGVE